MDYRQLLFYQKAREVIKLVDAECKAWPKTMQVWEIARQLFRSAASIGANIAEGHGRHEGLEYIHFLKIAQGSANEVDHWLHTAIDCQIGDETTIRKIIALNSETRKMIAASIISLHKSGKGKSIRESSSDYAPDPSPLTPLLSTDDFDKE